MGIAYSQNLRERVLSSVDGGLGAYAPWLHCFGLASRIFTALMRHRGPGRARPAATAAGRRPSSAPFDEALRVRVYAQPDVTLAGLQTRLADHVLTVNLGCWWARFRHLRLALTRELER